MSITMAINSLGNQSLIPMLIKNLNKCRLVTEIIIWDNSPNSHLTINDNYNNKVKIINSNVNMGLSTKWAMGLFAQNNCVITQDDNYLVPEQCIGAMHKRWSKEPEIMHGIIGYNFSAQDEVPDIIKNGDAQFVIAGLTVLDRSWCARYFDELESFKETYGDNQFDLVNKKGYDAFMSYLIMKTSKKLNLIHGDVGIKRIEKSPNADSTLRKLPKFDEQKIKLIENIRKHFSADTTT